LGGRDPKTVFKPGKQFWNGTVSSTDDTKCDIKIISQSATEFFNTSGISAPIIGDERGIALNNVFVWTNFRPAGPSTATLLSKDTMIWPGFMQYGYTPSKLCSSQYATGSGWAWYRPWDNLWMAGAVFQCTKTSEWYATAHWYGNTSQTDEKWAYNVFAAADFNGNLKSSRALYCVEQ
jgi:hypothetical protein